MSKKLRSGINQERKNLIRQMINDYGIESLSDIKSAIIESLNASYKRFNKARPVFSSKQSLFKSLYLVTDLISKKWTIPVKNWGQIYSELMIVFGRDRIEK